MAGKTPFFAENRPVSVPGFLGNIISQVGKNVSDAGREERFQSGNGKFQFRIAEFELFETEPSSHAAEPVGNVVEPVGNDAGHRGNVAGNQSGGVGMESDVTKPGSDDERLESGFGKFELGETESRSNAMGKEVDDVSDASGDAGQEGKIVSDVGNVVRRWLRIESESEYAGLRRLWLSRR